MNDTDEDSVLVRAKRLLARKITGESNNKMLLFLVCISSLTKDPLSAIVKGPSAAGKSHLANRVLDVFRKLGNVIEYSRVTSAYIDNMASKNRPPKPQQNKNESNEEFLNRITQWKQESRRVDLTGKILFIDELRGIQNAQSPKLLISEGRLRLGTVINGEAVEIEVLGTPTIITTTTQPALEDPEFENRVLPIQIDETETQTEAVLKHEATAFEDPIRSFLDPEEEELLEHLKALKPYDVAVPHASTLAEKYPKKNLVARRDFPKLIKLIKVITYLNQSRRQLAKKVVDIVLVSRLGDVQQASEFGLASLKESLTGVSDKENEILSVFKDQVEVRKGQSGLPESKTVYGYLTVRDVFGNIGRRVRRGEQWTRDHINRLVNEGFLEEHPDNVPGRKGLKYCYSELPAETLSIDSNTDIDANDWANKYGYQLLDPPTSLDWATTQGPYETSSVRLSTPNYPPNSQFGEAPESAADFGTDNSPNGIIAQPKPEAPFRLPDPNNGILQPPFLEVGDCSGCHTQNVPLRPDHQNAYLVCKLCYDSASVEAS